MAKQGASGSILFSLPNRTYQPGTFTSPTYTVPAGVVELDTNFTIVPADLADPTKSMTFECDKFDVDSQTWRFDHGFTWQGGGTDKNGNPAGSPSQGVNGLSQGDQLRAVIILDQPLTTAVTITTF